MRVTRTLDAHNTIGFPFCVISGAPAPENLRSGSNPKERELSCCHYLTLFLFFLSFMCFVFFFFLFHEGSPLLIISELLISFECGHGGQLSIHATLPLREENSDYLCTTRQMRVLCCLRYHPSRSHEPKFRNYPSRSGGKLIHPFVVGSSHPIPFLCLVVEG